MTKPAKRELNQAPEVVSMPMDQITLLPEFQDMLPVEGSEYRELMRLIKRNGQEDAVWLWKHEGKNIMIDGHTRYLIMKGLGYTEIFARFREFLDAQEAFKFIGDNQAGRRNSLPFVKFLHYQGWMAELHKKAEERKKRGKEDAGGERTNAIIARKIGVSEAQVTRMVYIYNNATPELIAQVKSNDITVNAAHKKLKDVNVQRVPILRLAQKKSIMLSTIVKERASFYKLCDKLLGPIMTGSATYKPKDFARIELVVRLEAERVIVTDAGDPNYRPQRDLW